MKTPFMIDPFIVKSRNGNGVVIGAGDSKFKRNITHVKNLINMITMRILHQRKNQ